MVWSHANQPPFTTNHCADGKAALHLCCNYLVTQKGDGGFCEIPY